MPVRSRLASTWALLLAGPVVGTVYFLVIYLTGEVTCADGLDLTSTATLRIVILAGAVASIVVFVLYAVLARRLWSTPDRPRGDGDATATGPERENRRFMVTTGLLLLGLFTLFVLFLAAPAIGTSLC